MSVRNFGLLPLAAAALPLAAQAESPASSSVEAVIVTAAPDPEEPPAIAGARAHLAETPGGVSIISSEAYERRFAAGLDDVLRDAPGVYAQRKWGGDIRISIRGSGLGNANHNRGLIIAQDGLPLNEADGYGDSQAADPLMARFTEVYRGGNALRFGGALLGGAINMVTPDGRNAGFENRVRVDGGAYGLLREHVAIARASERWDVFAAATNQTGQSYRPQSQQNIQFGSLSLGRKLGERAEMRAILGGWNINQEIPGALTLSQFRANSRQPAAANYAGDQGRNQRGLRGVVRATLTPTETTVIDLGVYAQWKDLDHPIFQVIDQQSRNHGVFLRAVWRGEVAGLPADAFGGIWLRSGDLDSNFYVNRQGARGARTSSSLQNAKAADVFGEARIFVHPRLALVGGATWGRAERRYRSFAVPGANGTFDLKAGADYDWISPRFGLLWQDERGVQVFANLTRSVEPPNFGALSPTNAGFAPVRAQEAWTAEVGTRGRSGPLAWDVTLYSARLDGEMLQYTVSANVPASTFNARRTRHRGVEAGFDWRLKPTIRLRQTLTLSDFRFRGDSQYGDNRLPIAPRRFYRAELRYEHPSGWFVAPAVETSSSMWVDYRNTIRAPGYAIANLGGGVALGRRRFLFVEARNLTDKAYISNVQAQILAGPASAAYWPGDGRSIFGGVQWAF